MAEQFMTMGASDRFFYYALTGRSTLNERFMLQFREDYDTDAMKEAADEALVHIPEFNKHIVIYKGKPEAVTGSGDVAFIPYRKDTPVQFGTEQTNGLLFYFLCNGRTLIMSVFHGLTDAFGIRYFLRMMLYFYLKKKGLFLDAEDEADAMTDLVFDPDPLTGGESGDRLMPYETCGDSQAQPEWQYENPGAFAIPETPYEETCDYVHFCRIEASMADFMKARDEAGVSSMPFAADLAAKAISEAYSCADSTIMVMSAINQRKNLGAHTLVNCSDSIFLPYSAQLRQQDVQHRCAELRDLMKRQFEPALHRKMAGDKVQMVRQFEQAPEGCAAFAKRLEQIPPASHFNPMTMVMTYVGDLSMGKAADRLLEDASAETSARAAYALVSSFGDHLHLFVGNRSDSCQLAEGITAQCGQRGIRAELVTSGHLYGDTFQYEAIQTINESEETV